MTKKIKIYIFVLSLFFTLTAYSTPKFDKSDEAIYTKYIEWASQFKEEPINKLILITAKYFAVTPYLGGTLDNDDDENLVVNFRQFDCTTFVETCIALAQTIKSGDTSKENYCKLLQTIRYRGGVIDGYASRLHYMTDWAYDGVQKGLFEDISLEMQGEPDGKKINYMSSHTKSYKQLKNNELNVKKTKIIEDSINARNTYNIIPVNKIRRNEWRLKDGDIVLFNTNRGGLDYSHMGIIGRTMKGVKFVHASSNFKEVVEDGRTLYGYSYRSRTITGISIIRVR